MPSDVVTVLREARALLARPGGWTQGQYARDVAGRPVDMKDPRAVSFCASGATAAADPSPTGYGFEADPFLRRALPRHKMGLTEWNDKAGRKQEEVLDLYSRAIALAAGASPDE